MALAGLEKGRVSHRVVAGCTKPYAGGTMPPIESQTEVAPQSEMQTHTSNKSGARRPAALHHPRL